MYFIRWVDAALLHAVRQVGLTDGIQKKAGWLMAACKADAVEVGSSETSPEAPRGIVDSGMSPVPCIPCAGLDWGGDNRQLWRCLGGRRKKKLWCC